MKPLLGLLGLALLGSGCATTQPPEPPIEHVLALVQCGHTEVVPEFRWFDNEYEWRGFEQRLRQQSGRLDGGPQPLPVNFEHERVLLLFQGRKPTPGYGLRLRSERLGADSARIALEYLQPPPGALLPQMATSPCLAVTLERRIERVVIDDGTAVRTLQAP